MSHMEKELHRQETYHGKRINVAVYDVELEDGRQAKREIVEHPGAVGILAMHENRIIMVSQYRFAVGRCMLEIPAGGIDPGEEPLAAAMRELREETGYQARHMMKLGEYIGSPGILNEVIHLYWAEDLESVEQALDDDEFVTVCPIAPKDFFDAIEQAEIQDGKTITAYTWAKARSLL